VLDGLEADQLDDIPSSSISESQSTRIPMLRNFADPGSSRGNYDEVGLADIVSRWHCLICAQQPRLPVGGSLGREQRGRNASPKERCSDNSLTTFPNAYTRPSPHLKKLEIFAGRNIAAARKTTAY